VVPKVSSEERGFLFTDFRYFSGFTYFFHLTKRLVSAIFRLRNRPQAQSEKPMPETLGPRFGVKLVCLDAMFTILRPKKQGRKKMICGVYREVGEIDDSVTDNEIRDLILELRTKYRHLKYDEGYWFLVNWEVFLRLRKRRRARRSAETCAREVHTRILTDPGLYRPDPVIIDLVGRLRQANIRIVVASNQTHENLLWMLDHFEILGQFDDVHTSDKLKTRKPFPDFWNHILKGEKMKAEATVHIGNSLNSDLGAARLNIRTMIWDPEGNIGTILDGHEAVRFAHPDLNQAEFLRLVHGGFVRTFQTAAQGWRLIQNWGTAPG
jgi:FMN phosphatase YigB (HAD superfamily)